LLNQKYYNRCKTEEYFLNVSQKNLFLDTDPCCILVRFHVHKDTYISCGLNECRTAYYIVNVINTLIFRLFRSMRKTKPMFILRPILILLMVQPWKQKAY